MDSDKIYEQIKLKVTNQLYVHAQSAIYSTLFNITVVVIVFHDIAEPQILYSWASLTFVFLLIRLFFTRSVLRKEITPKNLNRRLKQFTMTICISGILFGSAGLLFLSPDRPAFNAFIFFLMGGMFAGSMGAFAINIRVFYFFSAPIILPVTIYSFILGGRINTAMGAMGIIFILMTIVVVRRMNETIEEAFKLGIENTVLAENTRLLNSELRLSNEIFQNLSYKDTMTNISNRRYISEIFNNEIERFAFTQEQSLTNDKKEDPYVVYGVFIIDIDHFKKVNDTWGHKCGDEVIKQFVKVIQSLIRKDDVICRWGGEEFVVILKRTDPDYIQKFAQKVIDSISSTQFKLNDEMTINKTCSLGYTQFPFFTHFPQALSLDQTIEIADQALYYAKENGRNKAVMAESNSSVHIVIYQEDARLIMKDLPKAIKNKEIIFTTS